MNLTKEWIGGFISGEGCFTFNGLTPIFQITLSKKDKNILYEIKKYIKIGKIHIYKNCCFSVSSKECLKLIKIIDGYIYGDKLIDYENWKLAVVFIESLTYEQRQSKNIKKFIENLKPRNNKKRIIFTKLPDIEIKGYFCILCDKKIIKKNSRHIYCDNCLKLKEEEWKEKGQINFYKKKNKNVIMVPKGCKKYYSNKYSILEYNKEMQK